MWREVCGRCGRTWDLADLVWRCRCGGLLDLVGPVADPLAGVRSGGSVSGSGPPLSGSGGPLSGSYLRRYRFSLPPGGPDVDLGAVITPAVELSPGVWVKADYEQPTGSFKDRGAAVMVGVAASLGVRSVLVDSSGNAGRAVAAHAGRAGLECTVYLPAGTAPAKVAAIAGLGASVVEVPGGRSATADAAVAAASAPDAPFYASHVYQPAFHHGVKTLAFELFEQVPGLERGTVAVPAGNGTLVLGLWLGFGDLVAAGRLARRPAIVAVQAQLCAPLVGLTGAPVPAGEGVSVPAGEGAPAPAGAVVSGAATAAAGIAIAHPPRAAQIRAAAVASGGSVVAVGEDAIEDARADLNRRGFPVEPTGAVAWAAIRPGPATGGQGRREGPVVAVLTGR